jgi:flagellar hook-length control protein FliK
VPLARAAEAVEHVLRLASARGVTHARIALRPAELGSVDVHLRSTAEGLVARVVAHSAESVQTLQQAAGDLRRSLEEHGLTLLNLDIEQAGQQGAGRAGSDAGELAGGNGKGSGSGDSGDSADTDETTTQTTLRLPSGVLVDVLA